MPLLVVGTVALDTVETPTEKREDLLGGSATYFSFAASLFTTVRLASVVGDDFPEEHTQTLVERGIDVAGLEVVRGGRTFRWSGRYLDDMNQRETVDVQLNVVDRFDPVLPDHYRRCEFVYLANGPTGLQRNVLAQCAEARLSVADTMDLWIETEREGLLELLGQIDGLVLNESEARLLTGEDNLVRAAKAVERLGPRLVVIKKGEHGCLFYSRYETYVLPAYPTADVVDPTGAGDAFAGGMMGYLAEQGDFEPATLKRAMAYGTLTAGFTVEDFSLERLKAIDRSDLDHRLEEYRRMLSF